MFFGDNGRNERTSGDDQRGCVEKKGFLLWNECLRAMRKMKEGNVFLGILTFSKILNFKL